MFQESPIMSPLEEPYHTASHLNSKMQNELSKPRSWFNVFHREIISRIDESIYSVLYSQSQGRPNASVRVLLGMRILKEGQGITDRQLFESCGYHLLYRQALGLVNLTDPLPSPATYYNFFNACYRYEQQEGISLLGLTFACITKDQIFKFKVKGKTVRMDSKLVQSNIAFTNRLHLFLDVLIQFYKSLSSVEKTFLSSQTNSFLSELVKKKSGAHIYELTKEEGKDLFSQLGPIGFQLIKLPTNEKTKAYQLLKRFMNEHFILEEQDIEDTSPPDDSDRDASKQPIEDTQQVNTDKQVATTKEQISDKIVALDKPVNGGSSLQSIHDPEAGYRNKEGSKRQIVKGYVTNVTETCQPDEDLRLITDVCTQTVTTNDVYLLQGSLERTKNITQQAIENLHTDGAYHSPENQNWVKAQPQELQWHLTAIQGKQGIFDFKKQDDTYLITNRKTGKTQLAYKTNNGKYRIKISGKGPYRYFLQLTIDNYFIRQKIKNISEQAKGIRANCEATINQVFCKLNGNKTKYRGLFKHQTYALCRAFWVNMTRIKVFSLVFSLFSQFLNLSDMVINHINRRSKKIQDYNMSMN